MMQRRTFLGGMGAILATSVAPAIIHNAMPVKGKIIVVDYAANIIASMEDTKLRYIKHVGAVFGLAPIKQEGAFIIYDPAPTVPIGRVVPFKGGPLPPGWEYV
jgi:hypothetical protein